MHKALLEIARIDYERDHGPVGGPGALLQLLVGDEAFAWLHPLSELAARADELIEEAEIPADEASAIARTAAQILTPDESATGFARRYYEALQASPDVVFAHASAQKAIAALGSATRS